MYLNILGIAGATGERPLLGHSQLLGSGPVFRRGVAAKFTIDSHYLGHLTSLLIGHDNTGCAALRPAPRAGGGAGEMPRLAIAARSTPRHDDARVCVGGCAWVRRRAPGWYLEKVKVRDNRTKVIYHFPCHRWIAEDSVDGARTALGSGAARSAAAKPMQAKPSHALRPPTLKASRPPAASRSPAAAQARRWLSFGRCAAPATRRAGRRWST